MTPHALAALAEQARTCAYAPYSHFTVGAALLAADGRVFCGANIENAAFSPSLCAERVAFARAVCDGARDFVAIAIVGGKESDTACGVPPCGVCLQTMTEFCRPLDFVIHLPQADGTIDTAPLAAFLPRAFDSKNIK